MPRVSTGQGRAGQTPGALGAVACTTKTMEEFKAVRAPEEEKVTITSIYLTGDAKENPDRAGLPTKAA